MKEANLKFRQTGAFTIEFAIIGILFAALLVFSADIIVKLATKGKLDRLAFSMVELLKERTQLYDDATELTTLDARQLDVIARDSLGRTMGVFAEENYGIVIEMQSFEGDGSGEPKPLQSFRFGGYRCQLKQELSHYQSFSVLSSWNRYVPLYRVTVCYRGVNWFGDLIGEERNVVASDAILIGR